ncbi:predicted protein [Naegleria gruberi]|uniref:Predicted protein n=1 Tax=Naegleria gruberi TaxID=5762 RepID=D2VKA4_NAEGR|nr:uncharacterized protein NAEGRDRAFT_69324 [Naegleria gruberi]EFC42827.1 predicted protein [Naegleria gruberi]|eukprot:XP_002675571.1 predicted protein [Naegleria gruberi strain NEG-M]
MSSSNEIEQSNELEALQSIYPTELTINSSTNFKIEIYPYTVESETETNSVGITLEVNYTPDYPESVIPSFEIYNTRGSITKREMSELKDMLIETANQFLGTSCVFTIASTIQEYLDRFTMDSEVLASNIGRGTPVTIENFREWRDKFVVEQKKIMEKQRIEKAKKLPGPKSGREIFEERQQLLISKIGEAAAANQYVEEDDIDEDLFLEDEDEEEVNNEDEQDEE